MLGQRKPRRGSDATRGPKPSLGRAACHRGQGCLTAEVTERHDALVPTSTESPPLARNLRRSGLSGHGSLWQRTAPSTARSRSQTRREVNGLRSAPTRKRRGGQQGGVPGSGRSGCGIMPLGELPTVGRPGPPHTHVAERLLADTF